MSDEKDITPKADCSTCLHKEDRLKYGRCQPGDTCVRAMSGRQITRFFKENPDLAEYSGPRKLDNRLRYKS
ncbi:MAG: hypothetical protein KZQ68_11740 [gamma proteobacterium symbiont of Bathyaustriella thionipta]|nr:hypothetical protein [gamma proteobacterium symbiont of Bathyaustriella thionipta]